MKKLFFFAATAAIALSSCSSDDLAQAPVAGPEVNDGAVSFSAYSARATRSTTDMVEDDLKTGGFGVFAYEQGKAGFSTFSASTSYPNFMYNQKVMGYTDAEAEISAVGEFDHYGYAPVKYYSNNEGAKHSFFAYAPYMDNEHLSPVFGLGKAPAIRYSALQDVDLLWAAPTIDKQKAAIDENIVFNFKHALAKVKFDVAPFMDLVHPSHDLQSTPTLGNGTTVTVKSIRFVGSVPSQALLDLETGKWTIENAVEGEYLINVNGVTWTGTSATGTPITDYDETIAPIKVIPAEAVKIEIVYDVETTDATTPSGANNHKETNIVVSKESFKLESGKSYNFKLDLGLTSVKFDASIIDWTSTDVQNVDLPNNHDFHAVSYYGNTTAPVGVPAANFSDTSEPDPDCDAAGKYNYYNGVLQKCITAATGASANDAVWKVVDEAIRIQGKGIYVVRNGLCTVYDAYTTDGLTYKNDGGDDINIEAVLISITPRSNGEVQQTDGEWVKPIVGKYYTVGSFLYKWNDVVLP